MASISLSYISVCDNPISTSENGTAYTKVLYMHEYVCTVRIEISHCRVPFMRLVVRGSLFCSHGTVRISIMSGGFIRQPENLECSFPSTSQLSAIKRECLIFSFLFTVVGAF